MKKIIRKILKEDRQEHYLNKIIEVMKNDYPLFKNLKLYGFTDHLSSDELNYVFSGIFEQPVNIRGRNIFNQNLKRIYKEFYSGSWVKFEYDKNGNNIYSEDSKGIWSKYEYDDNRNQIYYEKSDGYWIKREYDDNGNMIYSEDSDGFWVKKEYDNNGNKIYEEHSDGYIMYRR